MSKTVWVIKLPEEAEVLVESGKKVSQKELLAKKKDKEIKAPTKGTVVELGNGKIKLEFKTEKITGQGLNNLHRWGVLTWHPELSFTQLDHSFQNQILVLQAENFTSHLISKARTLGVSGLIVFGEKIKKNNWPIPVLVVDKDNAELIKKRHGVKCLLNANSNCLLIPEGAES